MINCQITKQLVKELKETFALELQLPTLAEYIEGLTLQEVGYRSGIKKVIDYLEETEMNQNADMEVKFRL